MPFDFAPFATARGFATSDGGRSALHSLVLQYTVKNRATHVKPSSSALLRLCFFGIFKFANLVVATVNGEAEIEFYQGRLDLLALFLARLADFPVWVSALWDWLSLRLRRRN